MEEGCLQAESARLQKSLIERYIDLLRPYEIAALAASVAGLSGIFLPSVSEAYVQSRRKVMIVGKETRGWAGGLKAMKSFESMDEYVDFLVGTHQTLLQRQPVGSKFFQFYKEANLRISESSGRPTAATIWANLFCVSWHGKSPTKIPAPFFDRIKQLSQNLLKAQMEILRPDAIFFVTGPNYDVYLKEFFEIRESKVLEKRALWQFKADGIQAFRTNHPQWEAGKQSRNKVLDHLRGSSTEKVVPNFSS